jgi:hypothetical protein
MCKEENLQNIAEVIFLNNQCSTHNTQFSNKGGNSVFDTKRFILNN